MLDKKIEKYLSYFKTKKRGDDTIVIFANNAPTDLRESLMEAHGERLPDDWIFDKYQSILDALTGYDIKNIDDVEENRTEIVDGLVDVYTSDLTAWLNSSDYNVYYITEAQEEYGIQTDGFKILQMAQYKAIDDIFSEVVNLLQSPETD